jgi:hypothetical protein
VLHRWLHRRPPVQRTIAGEGGVDAHTLKSARGSFLVEVGPDRLLLQNFAGNSAFAARVDGGLQLAGTPREYTYQLGDRQLTGIEVELLAGDGAELSDLVNTSMRWVRDLDYRNSMGVSGAADPYAGRQEVLRRALEVLAPHLDPQQQRRLASWHTPEIRLADGRVEIRHETLASGALHLVELTPLDGARFTRRGAALVLEKPARQRSADRLRAPLRRLLHALAGVLPAGLTDAATTALRRRVPGPAARLRQVLGGKARFAVRYVVDRPPLELAERVTHGRSGRRERTQELLFFRHRLLAGLPYYASPFGRDTLITLIGAGLQDPDRPRALRREIARVRAALRSRRLSPAEQRQHRELLQALQSLRRQAEAAVLEPALVADSLGNVLDLVSPEGYVTHERHEGEHAALERLIELVHWVAAHGDGRSSGELRDEVQRRLPLLESPRDDNPMIDGEPLLAIALGLAEKHLPAAHFARTFTGARLDKLARLAAYLARQTGAYAERPVPANLLRFKSGRPIGSWRDSLGGTGWRFDQLGVVPYDVNLLVPAALRAMARLLASAHFPRADFLAALTAHDPDQAALFADPRLLEERARRWDGAAEQFEVRIDRDTFIERVRAYLTHPGRFTAEERAALRAQRFHSGHSVGDVLDGRVIPPELPGQLRIPALSLTADDEPIAPIHNDTALVAALRSDLDPLPLALLQRQAALLDLPFPFGPRTPVGTAIVAPAALASQPDIELAFGRDRYHGPHIWGHPEKLEKMAWAAALLRTDAVADTLAFTRRVLHIDAGIRRSGPDLSQAELRLFRVAPAPTAGSWPGRLWRAALRWWHGDDPERRIRAAPYVSETRANWHQAWATIADGVY